MSQDTQANDITALTAQLSNDQLSTWSEDKKATFVKTFNDRIRVARFILLATARQIVNKAKDRHFISDKHIKPLKDSWCSTPEDLFEPQGAYGTPSYQNYRKFVGGRPTTELEAIAALRASDIINQLPGLNEAVRIISPEVALMIEKRSKLLKRGKELFEESEGLTGPLDMDDLDQTMTLATFRENVKLREKQKLALLSKLDDIGDEGRSLDTKIDKFLYDGLPGLSDAVIKVVKEYVERSAGFSALNRRVAEQVQFGDSEAAMEMLKTFEKDEVRISGDVKAQFDAAMEALKLAGKKGLSAGRQKKLASGKV
jgi:hypothetical protein